MKKRFYVFENRSEAEFQKLLASDIAAHKVAEDKYVIVKTRDHDHKDKVYTEAEFFKVVDDVCGNIEAPTENTDYAR